MVIGLVQCKTQNSQTETATTPPISFDDSTLTSIGDYVKGIATKSHCRMTVAVADSAGARHYVGYDGRADTAITDFGGTIDIGSCTKLFTAAAIWQLMEKGKFRKEDKLTQLLQLSAVDYNKLLVVDGKNYIDSVTVQQMLNHTSGIPDYFPAESDDKVFAEYNDSTVRFSPEQLLGMSQKNMQQAFIPGSSFHYSNANYLLLGMLIEKYSGQSYHDYLREHILQPLKLEHTWFASVSWPAYRAPGHYNGKETVMPATMAGAAGEIICTLDDMQTFVRGWYSGKLFAQPGTLTDYHQNGFGPMGSGVDYGLGVVRIYNLSYGHAGQTFGFQSYMGALPNGNSFVLGIDDAAVSAWTPAMVMSSMLTGTK